MAISDLLNRRLRAEPDDDEYMGESAEKVNESGSNEVSDDDEDSLGDASNASSIEDDGDDDLNNLSEEEEEEEEEEGEDNDTTIQNSINTISFGALAKAQESIGPRKRRPPHHEPSKSATDSSHPVPTNPNPVDEIRARLREAREAKEKKAKKESRQSKHAPMIQSSKRAVSRKRPAVELPPTPKARDPRFDPTVLSNNTRQPNPDKAYAFLDEYRASELKDLKARMAKTKNADEKEELKKLVRSMSDRMRSIQDKKREGEIMAEHKRNEKRLIREGKKSSPYYLKKSDLKQRAMVKKYEGMKGRERSKALERRRKKVAQRERREMPMERRV